jgi:hypothetical protein
VAPRRARPAARDVFCNFPFDTAYEPLYLALVAALVCTGQTPRSVLEIPPSRDRLERILGLLETCRYSVHDLSRVQVGPRGLPRFNMSFELGLAISVWRQSPRAHEFGLLEERPNRIQTTLSDLNGYDPYIHEGRPEGMFAAISDMFRKLRPFPVEQLRQFRFVHRSLTTFRREQFGGTSAYSGDHFGLLVSAAREFVAVSTLLPT